MGQYFKFVNHTKKEYLCPWCIGAGAKFFEWTSNEPSALVLFLLRKSSETGGGDIRNVDDAVQGRWAGDNVMLLGDYDDEYDWDQIKSYLNISQAAILAWNKQCPGLEKLSLESTCSCLE